MLVIIIAPLSVTRLVTWPDPTWHKPAAISFCGILWNASGLINVCLYIYTRPSIVSGAPCFRRRASAAQEGSAGPTGATPAPRFQANVTMPEVPMRSGVSSSENLPDEGADYAYVLGNRHASDSGYRGHHQQATSYPDEDRLGYGYQMRTRASASSNGSGTSYPPLRSGNPN